MEPRIQYTKTADGVNVAYATLGDGPPIVFASNIFGGLHMAQAVLTNAWNIDDHLAAGRQVVLYDVRGAGSSDRNVEDFSLEARVLDLEAVVDSVGVARFPLIGFGTGAHTAIAYAVFHPEAASHLILGNPFISGAEFYRTVPAMRAVKAMQGMAEDEWEYFTQSLAGGLLGFDDAGEANRLAKAMQSGMRPGDFLRFREAAEMIDVTELLPRVSVPTLVMRDDSIRIANELARGVAAAIPGAHFVISSDREAALAGFLGEKRAAQRSPRGSATGALQTILFTDVEGSTALTDRLGDAAARDVLREHERITREALKAHGGSEVKTMGDGFMASFGSATKALECAIAIQKAFGGPGTNVGAEQLRDAVPASHDEGTVAQPLRPETPIRVRIGLNVGEPIAESGDLFGTAVIVAARVAAQATGGEILVSDVVRQLVAGKGFLFNDRGEHALKGFEDPVRVWAVRTAA